MDAVPQEDRITTVNALAREAADVRRELAVLDPHEQGKRDGLEAKAHWLYSEAMEFCIPLVQAHANRMCPDSLRAAGLWDDMVGYGMAAVCKAWNRYDPKKEWANGAQFTTYAWRWYDGACKKALKAYLRHAEYEVDTGREDDDEHFPGDDLEDQQTQPLDAVVMAEFKRVSSECISRLTAYQAEAVRLWLEHELGYTAIAERLGLEVEAAKSRLDRGRSQWRECMKRYLRD